MFTRSDLEALMDASPSPGVSLFLPTHVRGTEIRQDPIRLKTLLAEARDALEAAGLDRGAAEALLAPAAALVEDYGFWQHQSHGLALFLGDGAMRTHKVPIPLEPSVRVGEGFRIKPLVPLLAADGAFRVLSVTAGGVRLHDASRFALQERDAAELGLPQGMEAVVGDPDYENPLQASPPNRPHVGAANISQAQVYGDSPEDWRKGRLQEFVRRLAAAVEDQAARDRVPIVLAADAEIAGHFGKLTTLGPLLAGVVEGNPDALDGGALHEAAYAVMRPRLDADRREAVERLAALAGSGDRRAAASVEAAAGRVDTLLLEEGAAVWGRIGEADGTAERLPDGAKGGTDLLDAAATLTLKQGGKVFVLPPGGMPGEAPAAAVLRY
ncbi:hypothetical protein GCM10009416_24290 [Craurococcus roseus]|uniref:Uncharacterized protein n=1 Tax=Craurococcus roseus TaxID=77585 RepID=A0ABN1F8J7_9PROT